MYDEPWWLETEIPTGRAGLSNRPPHPGPTQDSCLLLCSPHRHHPIWQSFKGRGGKSHGPQSPPPLPTICCSGAHLPELHAMGQVHTLDPIAWGRTDDSVELGFSGSQIPVPISQPFTILEIPKNLKCDEQDNLHPPPPRPATLQDVHLLIPGMHYLTWQRGLCR